MRDTLAVRMHRHDFLGTMCTHGITFGEKVRLLPQLLVAVGTFLLLHAALVCGQFATSVSVSGSGSAGLTAAADNVAAAGSAVARARAWPSSVARVTRRVQSAPSQRGTISAVEFPQAFANCSFAMIEVSRCLAHA